MFASKTLTEHLARGAVGLTAVALALALADTSLVFPLVLLPIALLALRGCPMCWLMGLGETIVARFTGSRAEGACVDGTCAVRSRPKPSVDRMLRDLLGP
jgi:hypothetical protein